MAEIDVTKRTASPTLWGLNIGQRTAAPVKFTYDPDAGTYTLSGTVSALGLPNVPLSRRVNLIHELSGRVIRETWSDEAGNYSFANIAAAKYTVMAYDHTGLYRAVIADGLTP